MALQINNRLDRSDLASFLPDLRAVKSFENLAADVSNTIPNAINATDAKVDAMDDTAAVTASSIAAVRALASRALQAVAELEDQAAARRSDHATIQALQRRVDELETILLSRR